MSEGALFSDVQLTMIDQVLLQYDAKRNASPMYLSNSVQNINVQVNTDRGAYFVRFYSKKLKNDEILQEHKILTWLKKKHIPVVTPLPNIHHECLHDIEGQQIAVFPWVVGRTFVRGKINANEAHILGEMQGRLHAQLKDDDGPTLRCDGTGSVWNTDETLASLSHIEKALHKETLPFEQVNSVKKPSNFKRSYCDLDQPVQQAISIR